jgi:hypothetical protein
MPSQLTQLIAETQFEQAGMLRLYPLKNVSNREENVLNCWIDWVNMFCALQYVTHDMYDDALKDLQDDNEIVRTGNNIRRTA